MLQRCRSIKGVWLYNNILKRRKFHNNLLHVTQGLELFGQSTDEVTFAKRFLFFTGISSI